MICPKCKTTLDDTSIVCMNCKAFVLPEIPRAEEPPAEPRVSESRETDVFGNLVNFVKSDQGEQSSVTDEPSDAPLGFTGNGKNNTHDADVEFHPIEVSQKEEPRRTRMKRFGSDETETATVAEFEDLSFSEEGGGYRVDSSGEHNEVPQNSPSIAVQPKKKWPMIVIAAGIFVSLAVAGYFYMTGL